MIGVFTDQAYNLILLAEDEARMLGQSTVEPEHLLLSSARRGNVESLFRANGVVASDIHGALVRAGGFGEDLVLGRVPRSAASNDALERAVDAAAARGVLSPSSEHVLLGLREDATAMAALREVGIADVDELVHAAYPDRRAPLSTEQVKSYALRVGTTRSPPQPGPIAPVFERFTAEARAAVRAAAESAAVRAIHYVAPFHLPLGILHVPESLAASVLAGHDVTLNEAMDRAERYGPGPSHQATGIFTDTARRLIAEEALKHAYRFGHDRIGTGHLLLAILDTKDTTAEQIIGAGPASERIARELVERLPGDEHAFGQVDPGVIDFDPLARALAARLAEVLPLGWTMTVEANRLIIRVRGSQAGPRSRIDFSWMVGADEPPSERVLHAARWVLQTAQTVISEKTTETWPADSGCEDLGLPEAHAEVNDHQLRMWYGERSRPVLELGGIHLARVIGA